MGTNKPPKVFISYSWDNDDHREWVRKFAEKLRADGIDVISDHWGTEPGGQPPEFMEKAIRESKFVVCICTPVYKERFDIRVGGVGYEAGIIAGECYHGKQDKYIPVLRAGEWDQSAPSLLLGNYRFDLRSDPLRKKDYQNLLSKLRGEREAPPPIGGISSQSGHESDLNIPVAVYAMTSNEVNLFAARSKKKPNDMLSLLAKYGIDNIASHYGESRNDWQPLVGNGRTIKTLIEEMAVVENERSDVPIWPRFYSDELFSKDGIRRLNAFNQFTEKGGILIVDAVSLFYDQLRTILTSSSLWARHTAIMVLHPLGMDRFETSASIVGEGGILRKEEFILPFGRFDTHEFNCDVAVSDIWHVKRWLALVLPVTRDQVLKPQVVDERRSIVRSTPIPGKGIRDYAVGAGK